MSLLGFLGEALRTRRLKVIMHEIGELMLIGKPSVKAILEWTTQVRVTRNYFYDMHLYLSGINDPEYCFLGMEGSKIYWYMSATQDQDLKLPASCARDRETVEIRL